MFIESRFTSNGFTVIVRLVSSQLISESISSRASARLCAARILEKYGSGKFV